MATFELIVAEPGRVMSVYRSSIQDIKKCSKNSIEYFSRSKNQMREHPKFFSTI